MCSQKYTPPKEIEDTSNPVLKVSRTTSAQEEATKKRDFWKLSQIRISETEDSIHTTF